jgi:hypothetical protein
LPIFIPPIAPQSQSSIIWGWYNRPVVATVPSGLSLAPLNEDETGGVCITQRKLEYRIFVRKLEEKTLFQNPRSRWKNNVKIDRK